MLKGLEKTFVMLKPDACKRRLMGEIIGRIEKTGLQIVGMMMWQIDGYSANKLYEEHVAKDFYNDQVMFVTSGAVLLMVVEGKDAVSVMRKIVGDTNCSKAQPGTIRGDLGLSTRMNLIHASDSVERAEREMRLFFEPDEIMPYSHNDNGWLYDLDAEKGELI